jgi:hypothetical protein
MADDRQPAVEVHHLPCKIKYTGAARVSTFFLVSQSADAGVGAPEQALSTFRGRRLVGARVPVPDGSRGYVLRRCNDPEEPEAGVEHRWQGEPFEALTWWGADFPSAPTAMHTASAWLELSAAVQDEVLMPEAAEPAVASA